MSASLFSSILTPSLALALNQYSSMDSLIFKINDVIINPIILLLFGVAVIVFLYGVFEFIRNGDSQEARQQGGRHILWGIIGIAIMMSVFGLVRFIINSLGIPQEQQPKTIGL